MSSITISPKLELAFWLSEGNLQVFVGDDESPTAEIPLSELILQEVISHALPATAQSIEDVKSIDGGDELLTLHDTLYAGANLVYNAIAKSKD